MWKQIPVIYGYSSITDGEVICDECGAIIDKCSIIEYEDSYGISNNGTNIDTCWRCYKQRKHK